MTDRKSTICPLFYCNMGNQKKHKPYVSKHKAYISKYKPYILKYVACIFCVSKSLIFRHLFFGFSTLFYFMQISFCFVNNRIFIYRNCINFKTITANSRVRLFPRPLWCSYPNCLPLPEHRYTSWARPKCI